MKCISCNQVINSPLYYYSKDKGKQPTSCYRCVDCYLKDKKPNEVKKQTTNK